MDQKSFKFSEFTPIDIVEIAVNSAGGPKEVGARLKGGDPEEAGKWIKRCINPSHKDKLGAFEFIRTLVGARYKNNHDAMNALLAHCGYQPNATPVSIECFERATAIEIEDHEAKINQRVEKMRQRYRLEMGEW